MRSLIVLTLVAWMAAALLAPSASAHHRSSWSQVSPTQELREGVRWQRSQTWKWQDAALVRRTPATFTERHATRPGYLRWLVSYWNGKRVSAIKAAKSYQRSTGIPSYDPPHLVSWLCIHRYEGSWIDPNPPYYGGLQMDLGFQRKYGSRLLERKGTADHWTPHEQMWVAEIAAFGWGKRGFYPWPNTARYCGLL